MRWPEVPAATGKFNICAANKTAAASPRSGTRRGGRSRRTARKAKPTPTAGQPCRGGGGLGINKSVRNVHAFSLGVIGCGCGNANRTPPSVGRRWVRGCRRKVAFLPTHMVILTTTWCNTTPTHHTIYVNRITRIQSGQVTASASARLVVALVVKRWTPCPPSRRAFCRPE